MSVVRRQGIALLGRLGLMSVVGVMTTVVPRVLGRLGLMSVVTTVVGLMSVVGVMTTVERKGIPRPLIVRRGAVIVQLEAGVRHTRPLLRGRAAGRARPMVHGIRRSRGPTGTRLIGVGADSLGRAAADIDPIGPANVRSGVAKRRWSTRQLAARARPVVSR